MKLYIVATDAARLQASPLARMNGATNGADAAVTAQVVALLRLSDVDPGICAAANDALFEIRRIG